MIEAEAASTWALVVGVDRYDDEGREGINADDLKSPVRDAATVVTWLRRRNVPKGQILVHAPARSANLAPLQQLEVTVQDATKAAIDHSIRRLISATDAAAKTRLFVFLMGHGIWVRSLGGRVFLTQDWTNLGLPHYIKILLGSPFP